MGRGRRKKDGGGGGSTNAMELCGGAFHPSIHDARSRFEGEPDGDRRGGNRVSPMEEKRAALQLGPASC